MFSREWGFSGVFHGTTGEWEVHQPEEVTRYIESRAGNPDLSVPRAQSDALRSQVEDLIQRARSLAAKIITPPHDDYLRENLEELQRVAMPDIGTLARAQMHTTSGQFVIRDTQAAEGGWQPSGHQIALANVMHVRSPYAAARWLATVCEHLGQAPGGRRLDSREGVDPVGQ